MSEKVSVVMTDEQYQEFMKQVNEHHQEVQKLVSEQAKNVSLALELMAEALKPKEPDRDWFAGQALPGIIASGNTYSTHKEVATQAYHCADAMLEISKTLKST
jgi:hypothetical protein